MASDHEERLQRIVGHIHDTPRSDLSLKALADVAAPSRFHFHRVRAAVAGETTVNTVRRIRLHRAAVPHNGPWPKINRAFEVLLSTVAARGFYGQFGKMVGVCHDSPADVALADLRSLAGLEAPADMPLRRTIGGGDLARQPPFGADLQGAICRSARRPLSS